MDTFEKASVAVLGFVGLIGVYCFVGMANQARVEAHCLSLGWTGGRSDWRMTGYCIARTDQTDVVVPWLEAKRR